MNTDWFDYELPRELIAQKPAARREEARMLVLDRHTGAWVHRTVGDLPDVLQPRDLLVVNNTRVLPSRVTGRREGSGGRIELLLLQEQADGTWEALLRASRRPPPGTRLALNGYAAAEVLEIGERGRVRVRLETGRPVREWLEEEGRMPVPPYIRRGGDPEEERLDRERYQTVFASRPGAVAAPTAGLHFTPELLERLREAGIEKAEITLHVGPGTFRPVQAARVEEHRMEEEACEISPAAADQINAARLAGGRIVAVGSTSVRTLETLSSRDGTVRPGRTRSALFIHPPYRFRAVDLLFTNFHFPKSTLLMMVCAFAGRDRVLEAYREAVRQRYRFYSYGDAMLLGNGGG